MNHCTKVGDVFYVLYYDHFALFYRVSKKKWKGFRYTILELLSGLFMVSFERTILCASRDVFVFVVAVVLPEILLIDQMSNHARRATQLVSSFMEKYQTWDLIWRMLLIPVLKPTFCSIYTSLNFLFPGITSLRIHDLLKLFYFSANRRCFALLHGEFFPHNHLIQTNL